MSELQPIRKSGEGFPTDEAFYLEHVSKRTLPEALTPLRHTLDWPVDMTSLRAHISCFFGQPNYSASKDKDPHFALDIQVPEGTCVATPETATFVYKDAQTYINRHRGLADVLLYSQESGLAYWLVHLDLDSLHPTIAQRHWFDRYSEERFQRGERIGQVGLFFKGEAGGLHPSVEIPPKVEETYERSYNHVHFEIHYQPDFHRLGTDINNSIDPLALLKRLY